MTEAANPIATFVKGFFAFLIEERVQSAVLHGWRYEFSVDLSDVDYVIEPDGFNRLIPLVNAWCESQGWLLCQVLRHETTAAYCVCTSAINPQLSVALDACSDYRRNESLLIPATDLLEGRLPMPTGGFRVADAVELRYRFAKAAAKDKNPEAAASEFSQHTDSSRKECQNWLLKVWNINLTGWDAPALALGIRQLRSQTLNRPPWLHGGSLRRISSRILLPSGLIVVTGSTDFDSLAATLAPFFTRLHFRRFRKADRWHPSLFKDLIASTLIIMPEANGYWSKLIPRDCILHLESNKEPAEHCRAVVSHLHQRINRRSSQPPTANK